MLQHRLETIEQILKHREYEILSKIVKEFPIECNGNPLIQKIESAIQNGRLNHLAKKMRSIHIHNSN